MSAKNAPTLQIPRTRDFHHQSPVGSRMGQAEQQQAYRKRAEQGAVERMVGR